MVDVETTLGAGGASDCCIKCCYRDCCLFQLLGFIFCT